MNLLAKIGIRAIRIADWLVNMVILTAVLLPLVFSCYAIWDSGQIYIMASAGNYEIYKPTAENDSVSFETLQAINSDVFAWLSVYGTNIDYPVVQGQNNIKYINTDAMGRHSLSGAIFLDYRNGINFSDFNSILYGHHMENQVMFGEIELFSDKNYFDARRNGMIYVDGREYGLEFFAFVHADAYDFDVFKVGITEQKDKQDYLELLLNMAIHTRQDAIPVTTNERIILLSTCSSDSTNGRDILIGRITDNTYIDPFATEELTIFNKLQEVDAFSNLWTKSPLWVKISAITAILSLVSLLIVRSFAKSKKEKNNHDN
jgi:sortase B